MNGKKHGSLLWVLAAGIVCGVTLHVGSRVVRGEAAVPREMATERPGGPAGACLPATERAIVVSDSLAGREHAVVYAAAPCQPCEGVYGLLRSGRVTRPVVLVVLVRDPEGDRTSVTEVMRRWELSMPTTVLEVREAEVAFAIRRIPTVQIVGTDGMVRASASGSSSAPRLLWRWEATKEAGR